MRWIALVSFLCFVTNDGMAQERGKRPMTIDDLLSFKRISDPQISPDGKHVAYVVGTVDMEENRITSQIWLAATENGKAKPLTSSPKSDRHPRWSPDGRHILFQSDRSGTTQLWIISLDGGEAQPLTDVSTGASGGIWSPDGKHVAFTSTVWPEFSHKPFKESDALNKKKKEAKEKSPIKARVFKRLFFRHWDHYVEDKRVHLFVQKIGHSPHGLTAVGLPKDVTPGDRDAVPTSGTFSSGQDFTFSPNGKYLVFTATPATDEAWNTNFDICRVPITGGKEKWETLISNKAADSGPQFSPDGKWLAYRAQKTPGSEADRWQLMIAPANPDGGLTAKPKSLTQDFDYWVDEFAWRFNDTVVFGSEKNARRILYSVSTENPAISPFVPELNKQAGDISSPNFSRDGITMAVSAVSMNHPPEAWAVMLGALKGNGPVVVKVSESQNKALLAKLDLPQPESVTVKGAGGTPMQMWILKPPGFNAKTKWPLVYLVHGGPQGAWTDGWSYRWNPEMWAAQGYVIAMPNPRGSTGFGQKYINEISGDWGGKVYEDLMAGVAYLEKLPYIDRNRMASAGASYGGYMMNWFQGHTTKFKTLITHCGVYNFDSMYGLTEDLWFDEWEHGGPPWKNRESYEKFSPHRYAKNFKTPMLIIHNDLDFRVPIAEGIQLFTTLQRLKVPSKMINFPDEGHWVLKPANSRYWHQEVFDWLKKYVKPGGE